MLKAIIFDMDGVLVDSEPLHFEANVNVLKQYGVVLDYDYYKQYIGTTTAYMWQKIQQDFSLPATPMELNQMGAREKDRLVYTNGYTPVPGAIELVHMLKDQGFDLALASSSPLKNVQQVVHTLGIMDCFSYLISGENVTNPKPAPDIFLKAAELLELSPEDCLVVEDSQNGVYAALKAGMSCLGFLNSSIPPYSLVKVKHVVESLECLCNDAYGISYLNMVHAHQLSQVWEVARTDRCIIREMSLEDIDALYQLYSPPEITRYIENLFEDKAQEIAFTKAYIDNMYHFYGYGLWVIEDKQTHQLIGRAGLSHREIDGQTQVELGYIIAKNRQNEGIGYEVCCKIIEIANQLFDIHHLNLFTQKENTASIQLAKKLGFIYHNSYQQGDICYECYEKKW